VDPQRARELLARERERVERELADIGGRAGDEDELSVLDQHLGDFATEMFERERDEGLADDLRDQLAAIERAEQRLEDGTYGRSVESGKPIPDERLEAVPAAERTVEEQAAYDRRP
jgi:DnaK suppressor protein